MKKLLLALLSVMAIVSVALAGDGPFPVHNAEGKWVSQNVPGLIVVIAIDAMTSREALVEVHIYNVHNELIARGATYHPLSSKILFVRMKDNNGVPLQIEMRAVSDARVGGDGPFPAHFHLVMNVENYGKYSNGTTKTIVLDRR